MWLRSSASALVVTGGLLVGAACGRSTAEPDVEGNLPSCGFTGGFWACEGGVYYRPCPATPDQSCGGQCLSCQGGGSSIVQGDCRSDASPDGGAQWVLVGGALYSCSGGP